MGKASEPKDEKGKDKIRCEECFSAGKSRYYHRLDVHLGSDHSMTTTQYMALHPGAPVLSEEAKRRGGVGTEAVMKLIERAESAEAGDVLNFGAAKLRVRSKLSDDDARYVPLHDERWVPGAVETSALEAAALAFQMNKNLLIVGPPGIGKTSLIRELAAMTNNPLRILPITGDMRVSDFVGAKDLRAGKDGAETDFTDGVFTNAAEHGHWVCANEIDSIPPQISFILHPALEDPRNMVILARTKKPEVEFNKRFRFAATANTLGYGDDSGLFAGTGPMNEALLDRFQIVIRMGYMEKRAEANMLSERTGVDASIADSMVAVATAVREAQKKQTTLISLSPRRLIDWAELIVKLGDSKIRLAGQLAVTNKLPPEDQVFVEGMIQRHFGTRP